MIKKQTNIDLSSFKRDFEKNGYYIFRNILKKQFVAKFNELVFKSYLLLVKKNTKKNDIHKIIYKFEKQKKYDKLFKILTLIRNSEEFKLAIKNLTSFSKKILLPKIFFYLNHGINIGYGINIGCEAAKRISYGWHQERPYYYKKTKESIHYQFPILNALNKRNGTMSVLKGSHKMGYIKENYIIRAHPKAIKTILPKNINLIRKKYKNYYFNLGKYDLAVFDGHLLHKANQNKTKKIRFAANVRLKFK